MARSIEDVRNKKMGTLKASKLHKVLRTTLRRLAAQRELPADIVVCAKLGRRPTLPDELEKQLVKYMLAMGAKFFGLVRRDVMSLAYQLTVKINVTHKFSEKMKALVNIRLFIDKHPVLPFAARGVHLSFGLKGLIIKM